MSGISKTFILIGLVAAAAPTGSAAANFLPLRCKPVVETGSPGRQFQVTNPKCIFIADVPGGGHCRPNSVTVPARALVPVQAGASTFRFRLKASLAPGSDVEFGRPIDVTKCTASARW